MIDQKKKKITTALQNGLQGISCMFYKKDVWLNRQLLVIQI